MKVLVWNCRGAGNDATFRTICELVRSYDPVILVLLETRVASQKAKRIIRRTRLSDMAAVEATGFAGGIWLFWRADLVEVEVLPPNPQALSVIIRRQNEADWLFTALYASPNFTSRSALWHYLVDFASGLSLPWLIAGSFNEISSNAEKQGGAPSTQRRLSQFIQVMDEFHLTNLGFSGPKFTWTNGRHGLANIKERLDKALCNDQWHTLFPEAWVQHLPRVNSDHCPILISLLGVVPHPLRRPFRMEAAWLTHPMFETLVQQSWNFSEKDLPLTIEQFVVAVTTWNREVFGNIFWNKKRVLARLHGIQKALSLASNPFREDLESHLTVEYNQLLLQEEMLWYQKSRSNWLMFGDANTRFFHTSTLIRRKRNRIMALKNDDGTWCTNQIELQARAVQHFQQLFKTEVVGPVSALPQSLPYLTPQEVTALVHPISLMEVKNAVFSLGPFKAPGPDGIQPFFYQRFWDTCGPALTTVIQDMFQSGHIPVDLNKTLITLIPKIDHPSSLTHFRPISLSNVTMRILSKILVIRVWPLLTKLISPFQGSFIPGRQATDNIVLV
ncbi:uncharacterized protein LOC114318678 [Camellia sinensis]|uniref:uncharacterized protein LOC114318678 n=1 Tax=Camellia sinensis TaxID=4442 RepID=UPI001035CCE2|nr:uncharacterized protein LOC114318678 [Camellia sinensis]